MEKTPINDMDGRNIDIAEDILDLELTNVKNIVIYSTRYLCDFFLIEEYIYIKELSNY